MMFKYGLSFLCYGYIATEYKEKEGWHWLKLGVSPNENQQPVLLFSRKKYSALKHIIAYDDTNDKWYRIPTYCKREIRDRLGSAEILHYKGGPKVESRILFYGTGKVDESSGYKWLISPYVRGPRVIERKLVTASKETVKKAMIDHNAYLVHKEQKKKNLQKAIDISLPAKSVLLPQIKTGGLFTIHGLTL